MHIGCIIIEDNLKLSDVPIKNIAKSLLTCCEIPVDNTYFRIHFKDLGRITDQEILFLEYHLKLASTTDFHVELTTHHYSETAKHCDVNSLLSAGCSIHGELNKISL